MKKSFMTRVLATGLSLAMAFSLSAATNVSVASAAAKPAMKSSKMTVKVGQKKNYQATAATQKAYKITKVKMSAAGKTKAKVTVNSSKKSIKVEGLAATKGSNVIISFKNNKTKKTTKVTTKVVVKAVDEKLTLTAEATHVKEIVVTANKAFADASKVKATVKKGTADRGCTATVEGSKITLAMDAKLTKGSYTITVEGAEDAAITVPLEVEKDETLTSFAVSDYIVAKSISETTTGSIKYAALNQYGDRMVTNEPTITCSFGKVLNQRPKKAATATADGVIEVTDINPVLSIVGTKGTVVLVGDMGVTTTKEISYNTFAKAVSAEVLGTYHINSATLKDITEGDTIYDYELLMSFKDQYGYAMSADEIDGVRVSITGGLTEVTADSYCEFKTSHNDFTTRTVKGEDYVAVRLNSATAAQMAKKAYAGEATLTIVNQYHGMLVSDKIIVGKDVVLKSMTVTADNGVYYDQDNEMGFEFIDTEGNSVTKYATLKKCHIVLGDGFRFEQKDNGDAKLIYNPTAYMAPPSQSNTDKATHPHTVTFKANATTGGDYLVQTFTFTVSQRRYAKGVIGIADDVATSMSKFDTSSNLTINSKKLILADQYSNKITKDEKFFNTKLFNGCSDNTAASGTAVTIVTNGAFYSYVNTSTNDIVVTPAGIAGTATVYLKYAYKDADEDGNVDVVTAGATNYDAKFMISAYDTKGVDVSTLEIDSINDGFALTTPTAKTLSEGNIKVKAMAGGVKTVIPTSQYIIVKNENNDFSEEDVAKGIKTKTAKLTVQVTTWDSANTPIDTTITKEYTVSREAPKLFKVVDPVNAVSYGGIVSKSTIINATLLEEQFKFIDQFGNGKWAGDKPSVLGITGDNTKSVVYKIEMLQSTDQFGYEIVNNNQNSAKVTFSKNGYYKFKITATTPDGSSKSFEYAINILN